MGSVFDQKISSYLEDLGSKSPTPGGGCAAALAASQGAALFAMVADLTPHSDEIEKLKADCSAMIDKFAVLGNKDIEVFDAVMAAMKLPKDTSNEKKLRTDSLSTSLKAAAVVPMDIISLCNECLCFAERLVEIGNKNVVSDIGAGVYMLQAGLNSSRLNVLINLKYLKDENYISATVTSMKEASTQFQNTAERLSQKIEAMVSPRVV